MKKNYLMYAAMTSLLGLAACNSGNSAEEQAKQDAKNINVESLAPKIAEGLANKCSTNGIDLSCAKDKAKDYIQAYPSFMATIAEHHEQCTKAHGAKACTQDYSNYLTDALSAKLVAPVTAQAEDTLKHKQEAMKRLDETKAKAKAAVEQAQQKAKEAAQDAKDLAQQKANQAQDQMKDKTSSSEDSVKDAIDSASDETKHITQQAVDKAKKAAQDAKEKAQDLTDKAKSEWDAVMGKSSDAKKSGNSSVGSAAQSDAKSE